MGFKHMLKAVAPVVALAIAGGLAGCDKANVNFNGEEGKELADLDLSGEAPSEVSLLGPDTVDIRDGEKLAIHLLTFRVHLKGEDVDLRKPPTGPFASLPDPLRTVANAMPADSSGLLTCQMIAAELAAALDPPPAPAPDPQTAPDPVPGTLPVEVVADLSQGA